MGKILPFLYILSVLILSSYFVTSQLDSHLETKKKILENYKAEGTKELFKVWHFLYSKTYNYDSELGIKKYLNFRDNVKKIEEHNANTEKSHTLALNHLADMTTEEITKYYNIKPISHKDLDRKLRSLRGITLDDFNDDEENFQKRRKENKQSKGITARQDVDHRPVMMDVRNQGNCGCCWAFATASTIEGNWQKVKNAKLSNWLSVQQLVDCDTTNQGCNGGWYTSAISFYQKNDGAFDKDYPYVEKQQACNTEPGKSGVGVTGYKYLITADEIFEQLLNGPLAIAVNSQRDDFMFYSSGVYKTLCLGQVDHAMVLVGYSLSDKAWILRNSWGPDWGIKGYMLLEENLLNNNSCWIGRYGYLPLIK